MEKEIYIVDAKRTALGKFGGSLSEFTAPVLESLVIKELLKANPQVKDQIDEVIVGNVLSAGLGQNPARIASVKAGIGEEVPAFSINKVCGSGLKSVVLGSQAIELGESDLVIAGGMESMSQAPYLLSGHRFGIKLGDQNMVDSMVFDGLYCSLTDQHMGVTAENIAKKYKIAREEQDAFALESHQKAIKAIKEDKFKEEIVPVEYEVKGKSIVFATDEQPRADTTLEVLSKLKPAFKKNGTVTAGNASSLNDGAAAVLLASKKAVDKNKLKPIAMIRSYASVALDPNYMGMGAYLAAMECLKKAGVKPEDIDLWELNEAFASQSLAVIRKLGINQAKVNVNGGSIAFGHPIGASGTRILVTLIHEMKKRKVKYGVASLCIGGGQGIAMLIESI